MRNGVVGAHKLDIARKLRETERNIDALINSSPDQIWLIDREYRLVRANKAFFENIKNTHGIDFQVGQTLLFAALPEPVRKQWERFYERAFNGERFTIEYPEDRKLAVDPKDYEVTFNPVYEEDRIVGAGCFACELTEQKKALKLIRKSEAQLADAQRLAQCGNWNFDIAANNVTWSDELYNVFGITKQTFVPTHDFFINLVLEDDRPRVIEAGMRSREEGKPFDIEYRIITPAGEIRYIHELGYAKRDSEGKITSLFGTAQNVTSHKKAEAEIRFAHRQLHELVVHSQIVREEERKKIEREIHDSVSQQLAVLRLDAEWIRRVNPESASVNQIAADMISNIDETLRTVKRISSELRSDYLDELGLSAAIEWKGKEIQKHTGIPVHFVSDLGNVNPERTLAINVYRICQEALTNIVRHAQATKIETILDHKDGQLWLIIRDNGQGMNLNDPPKKNSFGLIGMKERAMTLRGELTIDSNLPRGTIVTLRVPFSA